MTTADKPRVVKKVFVAKNDKKNPYNTNYCMELPKPKFPVPDLSLYLISQTTQTIEPSCYCDLSH